MNPTRVTVYVNDVEAYGFNGSDPCPLVFGTQSWGEWVSDHFPDTSPSMSVHVHSEDWVLVEAIRSAGVRIL